jgi:hypothetical protein
MQKRQGQITSQLSILKKMDTFPNETIHIIPEYVVHLYGHRNKMGMY